MNRTNIASHSYGKNMDVIFCTLFGFLSQFGFTHTSHITGKISENTTFFYRMLAVAPSVRTTIDFNVFYLKKGGYPVMGIYTEYPAINIEKKCSCTEYGQLRNDNLHPYLREGQYRTTTCTLSDNDAVNCTGRVNVQDYIPRNFYLSFGSTCDWKHFSALQGLTCNISFIKQSNDTSRCVNYPKMFRSKSCKGSYYQTSLPNLVGDETLDQINNYFKVVEAYQIALLLEGRCYQHIEEVACYFVFPKCDPLTNQVKHPCREMCRAIKEACLQALISIAAKTKSQFIKEMFSGDLSKNVNCDYLPSRHSSIPCFYKPVMCDSPPDVINSTMILNTTQKETYELRNVVTYACVNDTFDMRGTNSTT